MIFNSIEFAAFLPIVFVLYWLLKNSIKLQNILIVLASYLFYGWWDWRFLILIFLSTVIDFSTSHFLSIKKDKKTRKYLLAVSILSNLGFLAYFKYHNFFLENFKEAFHFFGKELDIYSLKVILPVGISFYTFQTLSYTIDVYRKKITPTTNFIAFASFVSFFPQLVAGPIERASNLLPQFLKKRKFSPEMASDGLRQILWGLFKKIVIADNCAEIANGIFNNYESEPGSVLLIGAFMFSFQIYADFSGYSDIAIGTAKLFGFQLNQNFKFPYFSRNIAEFWRKWHISLTTWFKDYVYIPLGGSRSSKWITIRNTIIVFTISGFWHGSNWTFIFWGLVNALLFIPLMIAKTNRKYEEKTYGKVSFTSIIKVLVTFVLVSLTWVLFRSPNLSSAVQYYEIIFSTSFFTSPKTDVNLIIALLLIFTTIIEWRGKDCTHALEKIAFRRKRWLRWSFYIFIIFLTITYGGKEQDFIYFQF